MKQWEDISKDKLLLFVIQKKLYNEEKRKRKPKKMFKKTQICNTQVNCEWIKVNVCPIPREVKEKETKYSKRGCGLSQACLCGRSCPGKANIKELGTGARWGWPRSSKRSSCVGERETGRENLQSVRDRVRELARELEEVDNVGSCGTLITVDIFPVKHEAIESVEQ